MGNIITGSIRPELLNSRKISGYNIGQIDFLREKFVLMCEDDLTIDLKKFALLLRMKEDKAQKVAPTPLNPNLTIRYLTVS